MPSPKITALAGGVGAARFLRGLLPLVEPTRLTVVVNTGDDRTFFGLRVCPDLDIVTYTLAGRVREDTGWGLSGDSFRALEGLRRFRKDLWFALGDVDLATHLHRTDRLSAGAPLSEVSREIAAGFGLECEILPMTDDPAPTRVRRRDGLETDFEEYLVRDGAPDDVVAVDLSAAARATPAPGVLRAIREAELLIVCPSNPIVSIGTIRAVPGIEAALRERRDAIAISPIVGGRPVKGPADRLMRAHGLEVSARAVAKLYHEILGGFVLDSQDADQADGIRETGVSVLCTPTLMRDVEAARRLARDVIDFAPRVAGA